MATKRARTDAGTVSTATGDGSSNLVVLQVGGTRMTVARKTLTRVEGSLLAIMFGDRWTGTKFDRTDDGTIFIDSHAPAFEAVLEYIRTGFVPSRRGDPDFNRVVRKELQRWGVLPEDEVPDTKVPVPADGFQGGVYSKKKWAFECSVENSSGDAAFDALVISAAPGALELCEVLVEEEDSSDERERNDAGPLPKGETPSNWALMRAMWHCERSHGTERGGSGGDVDRVRAAAFDFVRRTRVYDDIQHQAHGRISGWNTMRGVDRCAMIGRALPATHHWLVMDAPSTGHSLTSIGAAWSVQELAPVTVKITTVQHEDTAAAFFHVVGIEK